MALGISIGLGLENFPRRVASSATPPAAPTGLATTPGDQTMGLAWDDAVGVTWNVLRSLTDDYGTASNIASGLTDPAYDDTTGTPGTQYFYWVTAVDGVQSDPSASEPGRSFIVCPTGQTTAITIPPGTWTLGTAFFGSTIPNNTEFYPGATGAPPVAYIFFDAIWYDNATFSPSNGLSVSGGNRIVNATGSPATLWNGEPP